MTMFRSDKKIPDFSGTLDANGEVTFDVPIGPTYQNFRVESNVGGSFLTFELELNGEVIWKLTGTQLDMLDLFYGVAKVTNVFNLRIAQDQLHDAANTALTGLVTVPGDNLYLRVKIGGHAVGTPTMKVYEEANPSRPVREFIPRFKPVHIPITSIGENEYQWKRQGRRPNELQISAIHFVGDVTNVKIEQDDLVQFNLPKNINDAALAQSLNDVRAPQSGYYHLDFIRQGYGRDMFDTFSVDKQLIFTLTTTDADDITALTHSIERVAQPAAA